MRLLQLLRISCVNFRMKKIVGVFLAAYFLFVSIACAESWPITSGWGPRWHPVFGGWRFHDGVDFGLDSGVAVPAAAAGTVEYAGWYGGYGMYVEIDHGNGKSSFYGHMSALKVTTGQTISKGQLLGYVGSTGYSTGPHLHLGYWVNGESADPVPFLQASGWAISDIPDPNAPIDVAHDLDGYPDPGTVKWDLTTFYEFGKSLEDIIKVYATGCKNALTYLRGEVINLLWLLGIIRLCWLMIQKILDGNSFDGSFWMTFLLQYGFLLYFAANWATLVDELIVPLFATGASEAFAGSASVADNFSRPGDIISKGVSLLEPAFNYIARSKFSLNILGILCCQAITLLILAMFVFIGATLVIYQIEFYVLSVVSLLSLPFALSGGIFAGIKNFPGGVVGSLIGSAIKIFIASVFITLIINFLSTMKPVEYEFTAYLKILFGAILFLYMMIRIPLQISGTIAGKVRF